MYFQTFFANAAANVVNIIHVIPGVSKKSIGV